MEWVRSWSHDKTFTKKFLAIRPEKMTRRKKRKKARKAIAKFFAWSANAINNKANPEKYLGVKEEPTTQASTSNSEVLSV